MAWDDDLTPEQREAASYSGGHGRLLAGPGTGKTRVLARRVLYLMEKQQADPNEILVLTFTRVAAYELRMRIGRALEALGGDKTPRISTLHSFALRQLLRNVRFVPDLPQPLRIADDWEERSVIQEDLKALLELERVREVRDKLQLLSSDWQTLDADADDWDRRFPDPKFLGAWREHRTIYGYVLRAELVYRLKRTLEQYDDFGLEAPPKYVLLDEYQDLNRCDLAVVKAMSERGAKVYACGDDDQSIYGFRKAHPEGIRRFDKDYDGARLLSLSVCKRCDRSILELGLFVAEQDHRRIKKVIVPEEGRGPGTVGILRFQDQDDEARSIAMLCKILHDQCAYNYHDILVLLRSDRDGVFSLPLREALQAQGVPVAIATEDSNPFNSLSGRQFLALLRIGVNLSDHLAWRTLLQIRNNGIGPDTIGSIYEAARTSGKKFAETLFSPAEQPSLARRFGNRITQEVAVIRELVKELQCKVGSEDDSQGCRDGRDYNGIVKLVSGLAAKVIASETERGDILAHIRRIIEETGPCSLQDLVRCLEVSSEEHEQEIEEGKVNIMTMHKAKGLTAKAVLIAACEDESIPGKATGEALDDERRLLYVSLTRAMHYLFITYCCSRTGRQAYTGRTAGRTTRSLSQFLRDAAVEPVDGAAFVRDFRPR